MNYDEDWKIVESSFWCRHKLGDKCVYHANPNHLCVSEKCPLNYNNYVDNKIKRLRNNFRTKHIKRRKKKP